jgi:vacuolar-type H+-ATPase subunit H
MAAEATGVASPGSVEALKRVKAAETEWESRLATARKEAEVTLGRLAEEADAAVKAVRAEVERERTERIEHARVEAAGMAAAIVAEGEKDAETAARGEGRRPADKKDAILAAVLGGFAKD